MARRTVAAALAVAFLLVPVQADGDKGQRFDEKGFIGLGPLSGLSLTDAQSTNATLICEHRLGGGCFDLFPRESVFSVHVWQWSPFVDPAPPVMLLWFVDAHGKLLSTDLHCGSTLYETSPIPDGAARVIVFLLEDAPWNGCPEATINSSGEIHALIL